MRIYYCRVRPSAHGVLPQSRRAFAFALVMVFCLGSERAMPQSQNSEVQRLLKQGQAALDAGDFTTATAEFQHAEQLSLDNLSANRGLLLSYLQSGRLPDAVDFGTKAVAHWPNDAQLHHWLGLAYFKQKMTTPALQALHRSETLDSASFGTHFDIALVLLSQEQYPPAAEEPSHTCCWAVRIRTPTVR
ncbi:MAG: hypothetical protein DMG97_33720 [Acidobacteria bacterium]|nr:MAG: hypothetical protein DMG97_33720 [Acidobacteriota bacterium]